VERCYFRSRYFAIPVIVKSLDIGDITVLEKRFFLSLCLNTKFALNYRYFTIYMNKVYVRTDVLDWSLYFPT
jgi:hypothetical protein